MGFDTDADRVKRLQAAESSSPDVPAELIATALSVHHGQVIDGGQLTSTVQSSRLAAGCVVLGISEDASSDERRA
ncbi:hypothetical protein AB0D83_35955 [Streptomyces decoyicus]|uniref:hypothetical protein n=1 Tax=Streptomyces decoyicus TaxID=249567 RepID=UPI003411338B